MLSLRLSFLLAAVSPLALLQPALAQQITAQQAASTGDGSTIRLGEIVVEGGKKIVDPAVGPIDGLVARQSASGTKTSTPLIETPQAISVVGQQQIRALGEQTVDQALTYTGVRASTFGFDPRNDWFIIRGFPAQVTGYFLDGLQLPSPGFGTFKLEPFGLERIEILKGPAAALYGGSNLGGIINAVSKRPTAQPFGYLEAGIDNYGNRYGAFDLGGPVSKAPDNHLYYRVDGLARGGGTQVQFTRQDELYIAPSLTYAPDAQNTITLLSSFRKDRTNNANFLPYQGTVTPAPFGRIRTDLFTSDPGLDKFTRGQALIGYSAQHIFNEHLAVRQNLRYADLKVQEQTLYGGGYDGAPANANLARFNFITDPHVNEFSVDTQAEARFSTGPLGHVVLAGIDYKRFSLADSQGFSFGPDLNLVNPQYFTGTTPPTSRYSIFKNTQGQLGEYVQEQAKLGAFSLVLSGRHDSLTTDLTDRLNPTASTTSRDDALTGRVGLIYTDPTGVAPYITYANSFDPQLGVNTTSAKPLVPTTGQLAEIGVKYQSPVVPLSVNAALFNLVQQNVLTTDPTNILNTIQTGEQRSRGFEIEAAGQLAPGLQILASYTGYNLRVTSDLDPTVLGKVPVRVPQNFGALFLDYTFLAGPLRGFGAGAGPRYTGASFADPQNVFAVPSTIVGDINVHYDWRQWRAMVNVRNISDKTYVASCSSVSACFYGERRTALFSLAYKW